MNYFITPDGSYYEGENVAEGSIQVTQRPNEFYVWNNGVWQLDLKKSKAHVWENIKAERDKRSSLGGTKVGSHWFHSDEKSKIQQMALVMLGAGIPANLQWKTMSGAFVPMTQTLAQQIFAAAVANDSAIFAAAEAHRVAMESSANPLEYDYSFGWPERFIQ